MDTVLKCLLNMHHYSSLVQLSVLIREASSCARWKLIQIKVQRISVYTFISSPHTPRSREHQGRWWMLILGARSTRYLQWNSVFTTWQATEHKLIAAVTSSTSPVQDQASQHSRENWEGHKSLHSPPRSYWQVTVLQVCRPWVGSKFQWMPQACMGSIIGS